MAIARIILVCLALLVLAECQTLGVEAARELHGAQQTILGCRTYGEFVCMHRHAVACVTCLQAFRACKLCP
jgi:hypothetical protein